MLIELTTALTYSRRRSGRRTFVSARSHVHPTAYRSDRRIPLRTGSHQAIMKSIRHLRRVHSLPMFFCPPPSPKRIISCRQSPLKCVRRPKSDTSSESLRIRPVRVRFSQLQLHLDYWHRKLCTCCPSHRRRHNFLMQRMRRSSPMMSEAESLELYFLSRYPRLSVFRLTILTRSSCGYGEKLVRERLIATQGLMERV